MKMEGNITLVAEYCDTITTLTSVEKGTTAAEDTGNQGKPCAYIEGIFTDEAVLNASMTEYTAQRTKEEVNRKAESVVYEIRVDGGDLTDDTVSDIRLLNPYDKTDTVFGLVDGVWKEVGYKEYGQYIQVKMAGASAAYCMVSGEKDGTWIFFAAGGAGILLLFGILIWKKKRQKKRP